MDLKVLIETTKINIARPKRKDLKTLTQALKKEAESLHPLHKRPNKMEEWSIIHKIFNYYNINSLDSII
jgi:hypothetical protein